MEEEAGFAGDEAAVDPVGDGLQLRGAELFEVVGEDLAQHLARDLGLRFQLGGD